MINSNPVEVHLNNLICDKCEGDMLYVEKISDKLYSHLCQSCGEKEIYDQQYPNIGYMIAGERVWN